MTTAPVRCSALSAVADLGPCHSGKPVVPSGAPHATKVSRWAPVRSSTNTQRNGASHAGPQPANIRAQADAVKKPKAAFIAPEKKTGIAKASATKPAERKAPAKKSAAKKPAKKVAGKGAK